MKIVNGNNTPMKHVKTEKALREGVFERDGKLYIKESSLGRVKKHSENGFLSISASNGYNDAKTNDSQLVELKHILRDAGLGFISMYGGGEVEKDPETWEARDVFEDSLFVPYMSDVMSEEEFLNFSVKVAQKFNQWGFLLKLPSEDSVKLYDRSDIEPSTEFTVAKSFGKFNPSTLPEVLSKGFSMLRKGSSVTTGAKIVFEGYRIPHDYYERVSFASRGEILY